jgi:hypothetical protein
MQRDSAVRGIGAYTAFFSVVYAPLRPHGLPLPVAA